MTTMTEDECSVGKVQVVRTRTSSQDYDWRYAAGCPARKCWSGWQKRRGKAIKKLICKCPK